MISQISVFLFALAAAYANILLKAPIVSTGVSASSRQQDAFGNYAFGYDIKDGLGATNSRSEVGDGHGNVKGAYTLTDIDGRARKVEYVADGHGFRAAVKTNEPGTAASAPAAALITSPYGSPVASVVVHDAGVVAAGAYGAPVHAVAQVAYGGAVLGHGGAYGLSYGSVNRLGYGASYGIGHGGSYGLGHGASLGLGHGKGLIY